MGWVMATTEADYLDNLPCQSTGGVHVGLDRPWQGESHAEDKERFFQIVRQNRYAGSPTRMSEAVRAIYGDDYGNTEYRRLSRLAKRSDWFETESTGGYVAVEPTPICFKADPLETQKALGKNAGRSGDDYVKEKTESKTAGDDARQSQSYPKDRARRVLQKRGPRLDGVGGSHDYRAEVLAQLATYRENIADKFTYHERIRGVGSPYLLIPYLTRYNDGGRARNAQRRFRTRLETATGRYRIASVVSLTLDPKRFESHAEATGDASEAVGRFLSWLPYQLGTSPEKVKISDFQRNGLIHFHIVLFGVRPVGDGQGETGEATLSEAEVRDYWDTTAGIGKEVAVQPAVCRGDSWILHRDDAGTVSLSYYLGKRIRELVQFAEADAGEARDLAEDDDGSLYRHALFWVYGKRYESGSPSLLPDDDAGEALPHVSEWRYVGTASFNQIPQHVVDGAIICRRGRPPPVETNGNAGAEG